mgnify:CR=1 FL=1
MWWYRCVRYWYRRKSIRNRRYIIIPFYLLQTSSIFLFTANLQHSVKKRKNILIFVPCVRKWNRGLYNTWCWWPASWHCFLWLSLTIITGTGCLVINPWPRSKRMAIKALIRMIAVATGITWPISVRIFSFMDGDVDIHLMPLLVLFDYIIHLNRRFADSSLITRTPPTLSRCTTLG